MRLRRLHALPLVPVALLLAGMATAQEPSPPTTAPVTPPASAPAQPPATAAPITPARPAWGRVSFFTNASSTGTDSGSRGFSELIGTATFESPSGDNVNYEYRADLRLAGYPGASDRSRRVSIYDAYFGARLRQGTLGIRVGQMWLNDLGGLGSVGGGMLEVRQRPRLHRGRFRASLFAGFEPKLLDPGYVSNVTKAGGFAAFDGEGLRRHVVGFVTLRNQGLTERSVVVLNNMLPLRKDLFVYQAAEYDVKGAGVAAPGSLTYFFANARYTLSPRVEFQGSYHRGRSIDSRTIVRDQLDGRTVDPRLLDGLRYESANTRVTLTLARGVRIFGGYGRDRNNHDESASNRFTYGMYASNVFGSGIDVTGSDSKMQRPGGNAYDSWYLSLGRSFGRRLYLTTDYGSSLSVIKFVTSSGFLIESRPQTRRYAVSTMVNMNRGASIMTTAERVGDGSSTTMRVLSGLSYRF